MSDISPAAWIWAAKGSGAVAGSIISLAYMLPRGRREAALRATVGVVTGLVFGTPAGFKIAETLGILQHLSLVEISLLGAASASLCAWWGLGALARVTRRIGGAARPSVNPSKTHSETGNNCDSQ